MTIHSISGLVPADLNGQRPESSPAGATRVPQAPLAQQATPAAVSDQDLRLALNRVAEVMGIGKDESIEFVVDQRTKKVAIKVVDVYGKVIHLFPSKQALAIASSSNIYAGIFLSQKV